MLKANLTFLSCEDSEAAEKAAGRTRARPEGAASGAWADREGAAGEQEEAAAGMRTQGGARERQSSTHGGGENSPAAAGPQRGLQFF